MWLMKCPCGRDHLPRQCLFLDFAPADLDTDDGAIWVGQSKTEGGREVELVYFNKNEGELVANFGLTASKARELANLLWDAADEADRKVRSRPAISQRRVKAFERTPEGRYS